jgi:putative transposase
MVKKAGRKLHKKSVRNMMTFRFYEFSQRLLTAAKNSGKVVLRCNEAYTSKTLSWTGQIKQIGSSKVVSDGNIKVDRDVNGARGIFLRALVDTPSLGV